MSRADLQNLLRAHEATINAQNARIQQQSQTNQLLRTRLQGLKRHSTRCVRLIDRQNQMIDSLLVRLDRMYNALQRYIGFALGNYGYNLPFQFTDVTSARVRMHNIWRRGLNYFRTLQRDARRVGAFHRRSQAWP